MNYELRPSAVVDRRSGQGYAGFPVMDWVEAAGADSVRTTSMARR